MHRRSRRIEVLGVGLVAWHCVRLGAVAAGRVALQQQSAAAAQQHGAAGQRPLTVDATRCLRLTRTPVPCRLRAAAAAGAGRRGEGQGGKYTLREDAFEVRLNASVLDGTGRDVESLTKDAFQVYEDGVPQTIASFRHEDLPVSLGILIDSSGSMYDKRAAVDAASINLVKLSNPKDEAFLVDFSSEAYIDQDFTSDIDEAAAGLELHQVERRNGDV